MDPDLIAVALTDFGSLSKHLLEMAKKKMLADWNQKCWYELVIGVKTHKPDLVISRWLNPINFNLGMQL